MPIGFPAYAERCERFRGVSRKTLLRAADDALDELGWHPRPDGKWRLCASVPIGFYVIFMTWGARLTIDIDHDELFIRSEGSFPLEWLDVGQHDANIRRFLDRLDDILEEEE